MEFGAAELKETGEFIGWFTLKPLPKSEDIEIGYRLLPQFWGKGLATEGAKALVTYGFRECKLDKIVAIANPANEASKRVLVKCGLKETGLINDPFSNSEQPPKVVFFELHNQ